MRGESLVRSGWSLVKGEDMGGEVLSEVGEEENINFRDRVEVMQEKIDIWGAGRVRELLQYDR